MKYIGSLHRSLCVSLVLCALLPRDASSQQATTEVIPFFLCSGNVKNVVLTKVPGNDKQWEFVITLNSTGTQQFKELEEASPGHLVDIVWAGVSYGSRRLDLPVEADATSLVLGSKWFTSTTAHSTFDLLNKNLLKKSNLTSPCGAR